MHEVTWWWLKQPSWEVVVKRLDTQTGCVYIGQIKYYLAGKRLRVGWGTLRVATQLQSLRRPSCAHLAHKVGVEAPPTLQSNSSAVRKELDGADVNFVPPAPVPAPAP